MQTPMKARAGGAKFLIRHWVLPFTRHLGTWAFVFNRWSGVLLAVYLYLHLGVLTTLAFNPNAYDQFLRVAGSPLGLIFDVGLIVLLLYHGLNGLRIIYGTLAGKIDQHVWQFWAVVTVTVMVTVYSAFIIFAHGG